MYECFDAHKWVYCECVLRPKEAHLLLLLSHALVHLAARKEAHCICSRALQAFSHTSVVYIVFIVLDARFFFPP